jgi:hypothetical protein
MAMAQEPAFHTPGMPVYPTSAAQTGSSSGQSDRFSNAFNPAFGFIVDVFADHVDFDGGSDQDGFDLSLRSLEFAAQAWVDPKAWAYFIGVAEEEQVAIEEAALHYLGLGSQTTLRAGRFFIDFGKQMQTHVHELRTLERPLALRAYLGSEVKGDGLQLDRWTAMGEKTVLRWSLGVFASLLPEEPEFPAAEVSTEVAERKDLGDLDFTGRVSAFRELTESSTIQVGVSTRLVPSYSVEDELNGLDAEDLESQVFGLDLTYGWTAPSGERRWTMGAEVLMNEGDVQISVVDPDNTPGNGDEFLEIGDDGGFGWFGFVDHAWDRYHGAGLQVSQVELGDSAGTDLTEVELYYTRMLSEFQRLRLGVAWLSNEETDEDSLRLALQYTGIVGAHGHGVNW